MWFTRTVHGSLKLQRELHGSKIIPEETFRNLLSGLPEEQFMERTVEKVNIKDNLLLVSTYHLSPSSSNKNSRRSGVLG